MMKPKNLQSIMKNMHKNDVVPLKTVDRKPLDPDSCLRSSLENFHSIMIGSTHISNLPTVCVKKVLSPSNFTRELDFTDCFICFAEIRFEVT